MDPVEVPVLRVGDYHWTQRSTYFHDLKIADNPCKTGKQQDWRYFETSGNFQAVFEDSIKPVVRSVAGRVSSTMFFVVTQFPHEIATVFKANQYNYILAMGDFDAMFHVAVRSAGLVHDDNIKLMVIKDCILGHEMRTHFLALVVCTWLNFHDEFDPTSF